MKVPLVFLTSLLMSASACSRTNSQDSAHTQAASPPAAVSVDAVKVATRELVRSAAASLGVQADQAMGCLACYLVEITGRLLRRRAPAKFCRSFVTELEHVGTAIKKGVDLEAVFWGN